MTLRKILLGTSAMVGAGMLAVAALPGAAQAAEVTPGGALDLEITGFARFEAFGGELDDSELDDTLARGLDFRNDTEVHVVARGKSEETGLEYGGTIEFEADTNVEPNTDESWVFLRGGWGEVRMGDEDGVADNSAVGAQTIAAGTGGIDGSDAVISAAPVVFISNTSDATKIRYYTPDFGGFSAGVSYTPTQQEIASGAENGQFFARKDGIDAMEGQNVVEGGLVYDGDLGGFGITASVVGLYGELRNAAEDVFDNDEWYGWQAGAVVDLWGFKLAGGYGDNRVADFENQFFTAGIGAALGPVNLSLTYGQLLDTSSEFEAATGVGEDAYNLVLSADVAIAPGLVLAGDVSSFDNEQSDDVDTGTGDTGWTAVGSVRLAF